METVLLRKVTWSNTQEYTQEKSYLYVKKVEKVLVIICPGQTHMHTYRRKAIWIYNVWKEFFLKSSTVAVFIKNYLVK